MIKRFTPVILILILILIRCLSLQCAYGQIRMNIPDYISKKFINYCKSVPREEIFVHTDREEYISGEDLWLNIYLVDGQSVNFSLISKIAYFELLSPENKPVVQKRIRLDNGLGPGHIVIPDTLSTGTYTIRAYTNWMKNFMPYNCYMKDIKVYNSFSHKAFRSKLSKENNLKEGKGYETDILPANPCLIMKVNNLLPDIVEIYVNADEKYRTENSNLFYLFIQAHGIINHVSSEKIAEETTKIVIPKKLLSPGISQITLFDSKANPVCERLIYTSSVDQKELLSLNSINISGTRSRITLEFDRENKLPAASNSTNFSISVAPQTNTSDNIDVNDYLVFGSEFGLLPSRTMKGRKIDEIPAEEVDSLLTKIKSNWINWKSILSDELPQFKYQAENQDHYLAGKLVIDDQNKPYIAQPGEFISLSSPGKVPVFQYARTNYETKFSFSIHIDEELRDLILQPDDFTKNNRIYIESSFSDQYFSSGISGDTISKPVPDYISKWSVNYQVTKIYGLSFIGDFLSPLYPPPKPKRFYGKPDFELIMKDFIKLPLMEEVFFELIPFAALKKDESVYEMSITDQLGYKMYKVRPVLMIDGVIINDVANIANLDPELVEKIDVVKGIYRVGEYTFYGIVNVITKSGDFSSVSLPDHAVRLSYRATDPVRTFVSPDYSLTGMKDSRIPDFRNTLYWNPSLKPDKDGKARIEFWTSDITSDYEINIQGITSEGKTVSLRKIIKVK
jgi:hypothetical protein